LLLLLFGVSVFFYWAFTVPLAQGVVASGSVVVDGKRKTVQHLEGGIIQAIHVKDGDRVVSGQLLIELESTRSRAEFALLQVRWLHTQAKIGRLQAERDGEEQFQFAIQGGFSSVDSAETINLQQSLFDARKQQFEGRTELLQQRIKQLQRKVAGLEVESESLLKQQGLVQEELDRSWLLHQKKLLELPQILKLEKELSVLEGEYGRIDAEIAAARIAMGEAELEILQLANDRRKEIAEELLSARELLLELDEQLAAARDVLRRTKITAPESGVVLDLEANTVGGVVAPGMSILDLVPDRDRLMIEARVQPADVDHVHRGMQSRVRLLAFKQRTTPILWGVIDFVSADALLDEQSNQSYYLARIVVSRQQFDRLPEGAEVVPGMPVEVLVDAGERTAMEYWLDPIEDVVRRGMREQ